MTSAQVNAAVRVACRADVLRATGVPSSRFENGRVGRALGVGDGHGEGGDEENGEEEGGSRLKTHGSCYKQAYE
jgi:hypothetical protein